MIPKIYLLPTGFLNCSFCWHFEKSKINYLITNLLVSASKLRNGQVFLMVFDLKLPGLGRQDAFQRIDYEKEED